MSTRILVISLLASSSLLAQGLEPRELEQVFETAALRAPVFLTHAGDGSDRVFVVERAGAIRILDHGDDAVVTFFDHRNSVNSSPGEGGLLSVAFHPRYRDNGRLYVYYTVGDLISRVSEWHVAADPDSVDMSSERVVMEVDQPAGNHNGGQLAFGPDGLLYVGLGDGGGSGDRFRNGQNRTSLLGAILRIDVDHAADGLAYAVPADNPYVGNDEGCREEIWAWGLRNPWRFSFDPVTGELWTGDVGQNEWEEVDLIHRGGNYGWNVMEGFHCFRSDDCAREGLESPVVEYSHAEGISVTGGYVYRGSRLGRLYGAYVYGDFGSRRIWGLRHDGDDLVEHVEIARSPSQISSFGEDEDGELYVVGLDGRIWRLLPTEGEGPRITAVADEGSTPHAFALAQNYPNPFNPETTIEYALPAAGAVSLHVFDVLGRQVRTLVDGPHGTGAYRVAWDGRDEAGVAAAPGVYFYRLRGDVETLSRKMILVK